MSSQTFRYGQALILEQMKEPQNIVGPVIREMREKQGMTQAELAVKLNLAGWDLSRGTLSKIEARLRCVTDYEISKLADGIRIDGPGLLRRALNKRRK